MTMLCRNARVSNLKPDAAERAAADQATIPQPRPFDRKPYTVDDLAWLAAQHRFADEQVPDEVAMNTVDDFTWQVEQNAEALEERYAMTVAVDRLERGLDF